MKYNIIYSGGASNNLNFSQLSNLTKLILDESYKYNWNNRLENGVFPHTESKKFKLFSDEDFDKLLNEIEQQYRDIKSNEVYLLKKSLNINDKVIILGDLHSSLYSLLQILNGLQNKGIIKDNFELRDNYYLIFLGDLVDRGSYSIEILLIAFKLKIINNDKVIIINGNHEDPGIYNYYGFSEEMDNELEEERIEKISQILSKLPTVLFLKYDNDDKYYQLCHGGIDKTIHKVWLKTYLDKKKEMQIIDNLHLSGNLNKYELNGFKWSDFSYKSIGIIPTESGRGAGHVYGIAGTNDYLETNNLHSIISGHQDYVNIALLLENNTNPKLNIDKDPYHYKDILSVLLLDKTDDSNPTITLNAKYSGDFLALTTSTSTGPKFNKNLNKSCYLILDEKFLNIYSINVEKEIIPKSIPHH